MAHGHLLRLRLFLEGVEVPVIGATISIAPDSPAVAQIQIIATNAVLKLLPRTIVHLFFYDFEDDTEYEEYPDFQKYKLLFMGELQTVAYTKGATERAAVLICADFSNYWDTIYQYNFRGELLWGHYTANFIGANTNLLYSPLGYGAGLFARLANGKSHTFPRLRGLLAGVVRCMEAVHGVYYLPKAFRGITDFASIAELRVKLLQQIYAAEEDDSSAKLFSRKAFIMWLNRQTQALDQLVTFRSVLGLFNQFIFHQIYPNPSARYIPSSSERKVRKFAVAVPEAKFRHVVQRYNGLLSIIKIIKSNLTRGTAFSDAAIRADMYDLGRRIEALESVMASDTSIPAQIFQANPRPEVEQAIRLLGGTSFKDPVGRTVNIAIVAEDVKRVLELAEKKIQNGIRTGVVRQTKTEVIPIVGRLNNQILRPDIWFAPPPRCNVLFPEHYSGFQWSRNFLREVSRLELQTTNEILGSNALFNGRYYAPNIPDMRRGAKLSSRRFARLTMEHELYTGIVPMFEKLGEVNLYAMRSDQLRVDGLKIGYAQRAVNFMFFKHRFAARQMTAFGRFNPWFVAGLPAVLIDRPMDADKVAIANSDPETLKYFADLKLTDATPYRLRVEALKNLVPTQYMGMCAQLQHALDQRGGTTSYTFTEARVHREDAEFLNIDKGKVNKRVGTAKRRYVCSAYANKVPTKGMIGRYNGKIVAVRDVTKSMVGQYVPALRDTRKFTTTAPFHAGTYERATSTDPVETAMRMDRGYVDGKNVLAFEILELVDRRVQDIVDLPIEEVVRPPWIWDGWNNLRIGKTYKQMLDTVSITDVVDFSEKEESVIEADSPPIPTEKSKKSLAELMVKYGRTIENAVDYLTFIYSNIRLRGLDTDHFVRTYTWRPIATMLDILGSPDLEIVEDPPGSSKYKVTKGIEGFHSRAFGDKSDLFGLVDDKILKVLDLSRPKKGAADPYSSAIYRLDVRGQRRTAVKEYVAELTESRGLLG